MLIEKGDILDIKNNYNPSIRGSITVNFINDDVIKFKFNHADDYISISVGDFHKEYTVFQKLDVVKVNRILSFRLDDIIECFNKIMSHYYDVEYFIEKESDVEKYKYLINQMPNDLLGELSIWGFTSNPRVSNLVYEWFFENKHLIEK